MVTVCLVTPALPDLLETEDHEVKTGPEDLTVSWAKMANQVKEDHRDLEVLAVMTVVRVHLVHQDHQGRPVRAVVLKLPGDQTGVAGSKGLKALIHLWATILMLGRKYLDRRAAKGTRKRMLLWL